MRLVSRRVRSAAADSGYMTVEMSLILPFILSVVFGFIFVFIGLYERELLRSDIYTRVYTIPYLSIRNDTVSDYVESAPFGYRYSYGDVSVRSTGTEATAGCKGSVSFYGTYSVTASHEVVSCSDRLRRWQLYGNITDE